MIASSVTANAGPAVGDGLAAETGEAKPRDALLPVGKSGVWAGFLPGAEPGLRYKYHLRSRFRGYQTDRADPFALRTELRPLGPCFSSIELSRR